MPRMYAEYVTYAYRYRVLEITNWKDGVGENFLSENYF